MPRIRGFLIAACGICLLAPVQGGWGAPKLRSFGIESKPPGAEVYTITGRVGRTPAFVSERDIYPNTYPEQKVDQYGLVILRRDGCQEYRKRITIDDINNGVKATLVCDSAPSKAEETPVLAPAAVEAARTGPSPISRANKPEPNQQLRWLRTIEELREHQLLTAEEERRIRRRILDGNP